MDGMRQVKYLDYMKLITDFDKFLLHIFYRNIPALHYENVEIKRGVGVLGSERKTTTKLLTQKF